MLVFRYFMNGLETLLGFQYPKYDCSGCWQVLKCERQIHLKKPYDVGNGVKLPIFRFWFRSRDVVSILQIEHDRKSRRA